MSASLTIKLSDQAFVGLKHKADAERTTPAELAAGRLEREFGPPNGRLRPPLTEEEKEAARRRFESCFGEIKLGYATGADNESFLANLL